MTYIPMMTKCLSKNIMPHFYHQRTMNMYLRDHNMIQQNEEFAVIKTWFEFNIKWIKDFWMEGIIVIFVFSMTTIIITFISD